MGETDMLDKSVHLTDWKLRARVPELSLWQNIHFYLVQIIPSQVQVFVGSDFSLGCRTQLAEKVILRHMKIGMMSQRRVKENGPFGLQVLIDPLAKSHVVAQKITHTHTYTIICAICITITIQ